MFSYHVVNKDSRAAHFVGVCRCGAHLDCYMNEQNNVAALRFEIEGGDPTVECGKRPVCGDLRREFGDRLKTVVPHVLRMRMVKELMEDGDSEPPQLPSSPVLRMIKHESLAAKRLHRDPIKALQILKSREMKDEIFTIRSDPFYVSYATKLQQKIHRRVASGHILSLKIDATSGISQTFRKIDGNHTGPIHLFSAVTRTQSGQEIALGQMLTDNQNALTIEGWLIDWLEGSKLPFPKEVTTDEGLGLLVGVVRAFTGYKTVNSYADSLFNRSETDPLPACYVRIDVAHFVKTYVDAMKNCSRSVAKYFKGGIGKLIMTRSKGEAEAIIRNLLIISQSPLCGMTAEGQASLCHQAKEKMEIIFTKNIVEDLELPSKEVTIDDDVRDQKTRTRKVQPSMWADWCLEINEAVLNEVERSAGTIPNELHCPQFTHKLLKDMKWIPLWSCICRDDFGFGRLPASSAAVEGSFNIIKTWLLAKIKSPRPDYFVALHKDYVDALAITVGNKMDKYEMQQAKHQGDFNDEFDVSESCHVQHATDDGNKTDATGLVGEVPLYQSSPILPEQSEKLNATECLICAAGNFPMGLHKCQV